MNLQHLQTEFIYLGITIVILFIIRFSAFTVIRKLGRRSGINEARITLICRYTTFLIVLIAGVITAFIFGADFSRLGLIFSSIFAVVGIGLFAIWSILSNITSGVIMFFSFPYKVGDKIMIHDHDFPIEAIIEDIRGFHLHLRIANGNLVTYPNNLMLQKAVTLIEKDAIEDYMEDHEDLI
ncbi:Mechanosensitive ion channel [Flavobacteriaceae bacterium MAR_2010_188]|nr:Mechanosensitive ion channel [Flavobacteriaceae bacterium MAR_2010_188]